LRTVIGRGHILALGALGVLWGCDSMYGVSRRATIPSPPPLACVETVIRRAPGVEDVQYSRTEGNRPLTWTGVEPATDVHTFAYRDGQVRGFLQVTVEYDGKTTFSQNLTDINRKPPQEQIDASRPVMRWIEERLEAECGMSGLPLAVEEHCSGVDCPPLATGPDGAAAAAP
jgi:hypothetical protein